MKNRIKIEYLKKINKNKLINFSNNSLKHYLEKLINSHFMIL